MKIGPSTTREQLGAIVCEALRADGHDAVLVGGSVVSIYTGGLFVSDDLDFAVYRPARQLRSTLERLGFDKFAGNSAEHPRSKLYVQFVNAPVAVGEKIDVEPVERRTRAGVLRMLSPLDCVLDRMAAFLHYNDRQCLRQAVEVALRQRVPLDEVQAWVDRESGDRAINAERFAEFAERVSRKRR